MRNIFIMLMVLYSAYVLAENPSSENYILQQSSISSGNDLANLPTSENYILQSSAIGSISGENQTSENYVNFPGYYLGEIIGEIIAPENVIISLNGGHVYLNWNPVIGANSYEIYSSTDPNLPLENWSLEAIGISATSWNQAYSGEVKKFYFVKASTGAGSTKFTSPKWRTNKK